LPTPVNNPALSFWSELTSGIGFMTLYQTPNGTPLKQLPDGWAVKVTDKLDTIVKTTDGSAIYRWYAVTDVTDNTSGYMKAGIIDGNDQFLVEFLKYSTTDFSTKAMNLYNTRTDRGSQIATALNHYYNSSDTIKTLDGGAYNNIPLSYLKTNAFPEQIIAAMATQESGGVQFDNEWVTGDYGHGVMQITSQGYIGAASNIKIPQCETVLGRAVCYGLPYKSNGFTKRDYAIPSRYYTNSTQGIAANLKDGFATLIDKHSNSVSAIPNKGRVWPGPTDTYTLEYPLGVTLPPITETEMRILRTVRGYNGLGPNCFRFNNTNYLTPVAEQIKNTSVNFPSVPSDAPNGIAEKMKAVELKKTDVSLCSPGAVRVIDGAGNVTGFDGTILRDEIPTAVYDIENGKAAVVYLTDNSYKYQVIGTDAGVYSFYIDNTTPSGLTGVELHNVPLALNEIYTYQVDWDAIARNERGVQVSIDHQGDGTNVDTFFVGANLSDALAPVTTPTPTGTSGLHGWFTSDVSVSLSASDGDGAGVKSTFFSLDNGAWQLYDNISLIPIAGEGIHTVQYYSTDFLGNQEVVKTLEVKIDQTAPEAVITVDTATRNLKVTGIDNLSPVGVTKDIAGYILTDDAGHTEKLFFKKYDSATLLKEAKLSSIQYDNSPIIALPETTFNYEWNTKVVQPLISQDIEESSLFHVVATYFKKTNETAVDVEERGTHLPKQNYSGLKIFTVTTNKGVLGYRY
jgi:hypothetical protein